MNTNAPLTIEQRIESALERIEAAVDRASRPAPGQDSSRALAELAARHETLRKEAQTTLDGLAALIADAKGAE